MDSRRETDVDARCEILQAVASGNLEAMAPYILLICITAKLFLGAGDRLNTEGW